MVLVNTISFHRDHKPAAEHHYLVIPKKHFEKIPTLTKEDIPMIRRMEKIGMEVNLVVLISWYDTYGLDNQTNSYSCLNFASPLTANTIFLFRCCLIEEEGEA